MVQAAADVDLMRVVRVRGVRCRIVRNGVCFVADRRRAEADQRRGCRGDADANQEAADTTGGVGFFAHAPIVEAVEARQ